MPLTLDLLPRNYCVCRLSAGARIDAAWFQIEDVVSVTRTEEELSVVLPEEHAPVGARCERGFRALRVRGPLAFELTGVLAGLTTALADAGVSVFVIWTFDTDILLVREVDLERAVGALKAAEYEVKR